MITVHISLQEQTVSDAIRAANTLGLSFNDYVEWRLAKEVDSIRVENETKVPPERTLEDIAKVLFGTALLQPAAEIGEDFHEVGRPYLVEELYKQINMGTPWGQLDRGDRIMIGKAFKRLVDLQLGGGNEIDDGRRVKVIYADRTSQNQTRYRTHRVG